MATARSIFIVAVSALVLSGCIPSLVAFDAPDVVVAGGTFDVVIDAQITPHPGLPLNHVSSVGAVVQLPPGMKLVGAGSLLSLVRDEAAMMALYTAEPGTTLHGFSAQGQTSGPVVLRLRIRAPLTPGPQAIKVALAGHDPANVWQRYDPPTGDFSQITAATHVEVVDVTGTLEPTMPRWVESSLGLPPFGEWRPHIAVGDIDGDGRDDIVTSPPGVFLRGALGGWLDAGAALARPGVDGEVTLADFNGDGRLDTAFSGGRAFLGDGGTTWTDVSSGLPSFPSGSAVAAGDVNGDGFDDLAFSPPRDVSVRVFLADGTGQWTESSMGLPVTLPNLVIEGRNHLLVADMNGDGFPDIYSAESETQFHGSRPPVGTTAPRVYLGDGTGSWSEVNPTGFGANFHPDGTAGGDLDGDGDIDFVFSGSGTSYLRLTGLLVFDQVAAAPLPRWVRDMNPGPDPPFGISSPHLPVHLVDLDQDGRLDLVAGRLRSTAASPVIPAGLEVLLQQAGGTFVPAGSFADGLSSARLAAAADVASGDFNGDGRPDLAVSYFGMGISAYIQQEGLPAGAAGTVGINAGGPFDVLTIDGTAGGAQRSVEKGLGQPFVIRVDTPPGQGPAAFVIWGLLGPLTNRSPFPTPVGDLVFPPHAVLPRSPSLLTLGNSLFADPLALLPAAMTPWSAAAPMGWPVPWTLSVQGIIQDVSGPGGVFAITNAVNLEVH